MRASVLGPKFFDAARHPEIGFRSTAIRLGDDGRLQLEGELAMRGVARHVSAEGQYATPRPTDFAEVAGMRLQTVIDRRGWGLDWQAQLPGGGDAVGWEVEIEIDLLLVRDDGSRPGLRPGALLRLTARSVIEGRCIPVYVPSCRGS